MGFFQYFNNFRLSTPEAVAKVQVGDRILEVNGTPIFNHTEQQVHIYLLTILLKHHSLDQGSVQLKGII